MENKNKECGTSCCGGGQAPLAMTVRPGRKVTAEDVPVVDAHLTLHDRWGGWKVRLGIGRGRYRVEPGLYAFGVPDGGSPVLVTANYKFTFDSLRKELSGLDAWILVLDTQGINVWCAAGKGTFGTSELVRRIESAGLHERIAHRRLILPQLGAPGVAGHEVKKITGFQVVYGPVRACDIKRFLRDGMKATPEMRRVGFGLKQRLAVVPTELGGVAKYILLFLMVSAAWHLFRGTPALRPLAPLNVMLIGAALTGTLFVPTLLPWIPFRAFALKGWLLGAVWAVGAGMVYDVAPIHFAGILFLLPAISAFLALNFTGSTTFTSQTGVNKEIRLFARPIAVSAAAGIVLMVL